MSNNLRNAIYAITEKKEEDWPEKVKDIIRNPDLLDKMTSSDLKRVSKMLATVVRRTGERAQVAESELSQRRMIDEVGMFEALNRVTARAIELTGGRPPRWSYLYVGNIEFLHHYVEFEIKKTSKGFTVYGVKEDGALAPLYDYDYAGLGVSQSNSAARLMLVHLRQTFTPREFQESPACKSTLKSN